jgi:uncharacterized protein YggE
LKTFLAKRFLSCIALTLICSPLVAQNTSERAVMVDTITVSGTGKASVTPDRFTFTAGVQTMAPTVEQAVNENNTKTAAVIAALKKAGATDREIRTSNFNIWPQQDYREGSTPRILGYQVSNSITVTRDKIADAGRLLQVAVTAGLNQASGLSLEVSNPAAGRDRGLKNAFDDARAKATLLAQAAGRTLGAALAISEGAGVPVMPYPQGRIASAMKAEAMSDVPVAAGDQEMSYTVTVVFALR